MQAIKSIKRKVPKGLRLISSITWFLVNSRTSDFWPHQSQYDRTGLTIRMIERTNEWLSLALDLGYPFSSYYYQIKNVFIFIKQMSANQHRYNGSGCHRQPNLSSTLPRKPTTDRPSPQSDAPRRQHAVRWGWRFFFALGFQGSIILGSVVKFSVCIANIFLRNATWGKSEV